MARFLLQIVLAEILAALCAPADTRAAEPEESWRFDDQAPGATPAGLEVAAGEWKVVEDDATSGGNRALAQLARNERPVFNVAILKGTSRRNVDLSVRLLPISGEIDQGGGMVWRARDAKNYYIARYNPLEDNFRVYKVVDGKRSQLGTAGVNKAPGWRALRVVMRDDHIECFLGGTKHLDVRDATFPDAGSIGLWTKADAVTRFDDLTLRDPGLGEPGAAEEIIVGDLEGGAKLRLVKGDSGKWGLRLDGAGLASAAQPAPVEIELFDPGANGPGAKEPGGKVTATSTGYEDVTEADGCVVGRARVELSTGGEIAVEDRWSVESGTATMERRLRVVRPGEGGFLSAVTFEIAEELSWPEARWFAPGMIYGGFEHLTEAAIGGWTHYRPGRFAVRIREDRLPAPLVGASFRDGSSLAVIDAAPDGATTRADGRDVEAAALVDERFRFGAVGAEERGRRVSVGYWYPGSEGEVTYRGDTYPGGQLHAWRLRFHPLKEGLTQRYRVAFRAGRDGSFQDFYPRAWRWAWSALAPRAARQDIEAVRRSIADMLAARVQVHDGRAGIPNFIDAVRAEAAGHDDKAILGFCGKCLEAAEFLLLEAAGDPGPRGERLRKLGEAIAESFVRLEVSPPAGEGFRFQSGEPACAIGSSAVFLRSFGDDVKALLRAYRRERAAGRDHPEWLRWCREFADWLLTQELPGGGFPRSWKPGTGEVVSGSPNSSYNAVPLLVLLGGITGEARYLEAAARAADFCWSNGQDRGLFVGGTIDNPDVLDKEAATLSLEAYLWLHEATRERKWIDRAAAAARFAETWIYCWDVPMPEDEDDRALHWKKGVSTVGLQLISTGHSLVDAYMAFDADEFARIHALTGDPHFLEVARVLLHGTKGMTAVPGRVHDLAGPGWQQEHWSLAPRRGFGLHRGWLPWVATSQLNGIFGCLALDDGLLEKLLSGPAGPRYEAPERRIAVDGDPSDWRGVPSNAVRGRSRLWFGQGMTPEKWRGHDDLSYSWRACWSGNRLQLLFEVDDDRVVEAGAPSSYLCDAVEVYVDPGDRGGRRVVVQDGREDWFAKCDPRELAGYELHFLPTSPPRVYLDHTDKYATDRPQTERFTKEWSGEVAARRTPTGYLLEAAFSVPGASLETGKILGVEVGICDDDGGGRESILLWTGTKSDFWLSMDEYGTVRLVES